MRNLFSGAVIAACLAAALLFAIPAMTQTSPDASGSNANQPAASPAAPSSHHHATSRDRKAATSNQSAASSDQSATLTSSPSDQSSAYTQPDQTASSSNPTAPGGTVSGTRERSSGGWGLWGLLGLFGLAGLARGNRRVEVISTTRTDAVNRENLRRVS